MSLSSISIAACFFAEDILLIIVFHGLLMGIYSGMAINLLPALLCYHYKSNQAMANGIAAAGGCLGGFLFSRLYKFLLDTYGASGSFLILGAVVLHSVPTAMLLENPKPIDKKPILKGKAKLGSDLIRGNKPPTPSYNVEVNQRTEYNEANIQEAQEVYNDSQRSAAITNSRFQKKYSTSNRITIENCAQKHDNEANRTEREHENHCDNDNDYTAEVEQERKNSGNNISLNIDFSTSAARETSDSLKNRNDSICSPSKDTEAVIDGNIKCTILQKCKIKSKTDITNDSKFDEEKFITNRIREHDISRFDIETASKISHVNDEDNINALPRNCLMGNENTISQIVEPIMLRKNDFNLEEPDNGSWKPFSVLYDPLFLLLSLVSSS